MENAPFELTVNQVIKLYDYYSKDPDALLLLKPENEFEKAFFDNMHR